MNRKMIIQAIFRALQGPLNCPQLSAFHEHARLNEDLYLDSVLLLQLLLTLEIVLGIDIPDSALSNEDFITVSSLTDFLLNQSADKTDTPETQLTVEFDDIKVHCFVSCLCEMIKADDRVDHRPFYFGVWDAQVLINQHHQLSYHSAHIKHDFFMTWYEKLYSVPVIAWYRPYQNKTQNIATLEKLIKYKTASQHVMVMLDMYLLPERENKFNQNPFPHYVMLEQTEDQDQWFMYDPDFRWEGLQAKSQVLAAIGSDAVAGGYYFDSKYIRPSSDQAIHDYFLACLNLESNPMTNLVRQIIELHTSENMSESQRQSIKDLPEALSQLSVLAIRKYAYEHGLAFFWRALKLEDAEFEYWCDVIEELVSTYKKIQYRVLKIANDGISNNLKKGLLAQIYELLHQQDQREFKIKARLQAVFEQWKQQAQLNTTSQHIQSAQASL
jgi:acyl carrier protein